MRIAIIGVGNVGSALARACVAKGHTVVLSSKDFRHAAQVAADVMTHLGVETGVTAEALPREAVDGADLAVLAIPSTAVAAVVEDIKQHLHDTVLVDPINPMDAGYEDILGATGSVTEGIVLLLPQARVVKAFNTVLGSRIADPLVDGVPLDGLYAGNDDAAKKTVADLLGELGFRPLDCGDIPAARALELMAYLNISLNARNGWPFQSGWKLLGPTG